MRRGGKGSSVERRVHVAGGFPRALSSTPRRAVWRLLSPAIAQFQFALTLLFATQLLGLVWGGLLAACRTLLLELLVAPLRLLGLTKKASTPGSTPVPRA